VKAKTKRRGGKINLRGTMPRGLPPLMPLYCTLDDFYPQTIRILHRY
jgi:hypothetical protein